MVTLKYGRWSRKHDDPRSPPQCNNPIDDVSKGFSQELSSCKLERCLESNLFVIADDDELALNTSKKYQIQSKQ